MITAASGSSGAETAVPVTSSVCTVSTLTPYPTCAIGAAATISAAPGSTSIENVEAWGHTAFAYQPLSSPPSVASGNSTGMFQTSFGPFVVGSTVNDTPGGDHERRERPRPEGALLVRREKTASFAYNAKQLSPSKHCKAADRNRLI